MYRREDNPLTPAIFFSTTPSLDELCLLHVSVASKTIDPSAPGASISKLQPQVIRCREIIFTEPEIIASPSLNSECVFHIILKHSLFKTGRLQSRFQRIGLEISRPEHVTPAIFQACLNYTIQARIAPKWNRAGQWLIQGRDFLTHSGYANAVKMDMTVTCGELHLSLEASTVRFPPLQLVDLDVLGARYNEFLNNNSSIIQSHSIMQTWCNVLPSMKKGQIVSVSHSLPENGPFKSYQDIKRHWKNSYGYRLPEDDNGIIYYQVYFRPIGNRLFTYPEICLRARDIQKLPRVDPKPILGAFLQDLQAKMSNVCGTRLVLQSKARYPMSGLLECHKGVNTPATAPNLSCTMPCSQKIIYRNNADLQQRIFPQSQPAKPSNMEENRPPEAGKSATQNAGNMQLKDFSTLTSQQHTWMPETVMQRTPTQQIANRSMAGFRATVEETSPTASISSQVSSTEKIVPNFQVKKPVFRPHDMKEKAPKTIPCFKRQTNRSTSHISESSSVASSDSPRLYGEPGSRSACPSLATVPSFQKPKQPSLTSKLSLKKTASDQGIKGRVTPSITPKLQRLLQTLPSPVSTANYSSLSLTNNLVKSPKSLASKSNAVPASRNPPISSFVSDLLDEGSFSEMLHFSSSPSPKLVQHAKVTSTTCTGVARTPSTPGVKRLTQQSIDSDGTPKPKKPRTKPQVQENVDVEHMAKVGQLNKVNSVTLISWLKSRGVPCKSKDKKKDIEDRVKMVLNLCVAES